MKKLLALLCLAGLPAHAAEINPGSWEIKVTTTLPGAPPAEQAMTQCLRKEDGQNPGRLFGSPGPGCEFLNQRDDGRSYRFDILCRDQNITVSGSGEMSYSPDRLEGGLTVRTVAGTQTLDLRSRVQARRLGPCQ